MSLSYERRRGVRHPFSATAEVSAPATGVRIGRVKDLSRTGSYVAMPEPFSEGTAVWLAIHTEHLAFRCEATVTHATRGIGMGLEFGRIAPASEEVLEKWLEGQAR